MEPAGNVLQTFEVFSISRIETLCEIHTRYDMQSLQLQQAMCFATGRWRRAARAGWLDDWVIWWLGDKLEEGCEWSEWHRYGDHPIRHGMQRQYGLRSSDVIEDPWRYDTCTYAKHTAMQTVYCNAAYCWVCEWAQSRMLLRYSQEWGGSLQPGIKINELNPDFVIFRIYKLTDPDEQIFLI
jgi:hypothetical protein